MIDQKSEIIFHGNNYQEKTIDGEYLKELFVRVEQFERFEDILNKLSYNTFKKEKIKQERTKIVIGHQNTKKRTMSKCGHLDLENLTECKLIEQIIELIKEVDRTINSGNLLIAIAVECLCGLWEENL